MNIITQLCTPPADELRAMTQLCTLRRGELKTITQLYTLRDGELKTITQICALKGCKSHNITELTHELSDVCWVSRKIPFSSDKSGCVRNGTAGSFLGSSFYFSRSFFCLFLRPVLSAISY